MRTPGTRTTPEPMPTSEKIIYICLAIVLLYLAIKTGYDLATHYQPTMLIN